MGGQNRVQEGLGRGSGLSLVDVWVSGPFPCLTPLFWSYLPFSVPLSVPVVVVMVVVACWPVVVVRALLVPLIVVLFALFGALVSRAVTGLVHPAAVMVVVVMVVVVFSPGRRWPVVDVLGSPGWLCPKRPLLLVALLLPLCVSIALVQALVVVMMVVTVMVVLVILSGAFPLHFISLLLCTVSLRLATHISQYDDTYKTRKHHSKHTQTKNHTTPVVSPKFTQNYKEEDVTLEHTRFLVKSIHGRLWPRSKNSKKARRAPRLQLSSLDLAALTTLANTSSLLLLINISVFFALSLTLWWQWIEKGQIRGLCSIYRWLKLPITVRVVIKYIKQKQWFRAELKRNYIRKGTIKSKINDFMLNTKVQLSVYVQTVSKLFLFYWVLHVLW